MKLTEYLRQLYIDAMNEYNETVDLMDKISYTHGSVKRLDLKLERLVERKDVLFEIIRYVDFIEGGNNNI